MSGVGGGALTVVAFAAEFEAWLSRCNRANAVWALETSPDVIAD